jgi:acyl-CoA synthetase (AMP-forming)/AMP-acid ligase II
MLRGDLIRPLPELLLANAHRFGRKIAYRDARRRVTYAELESRTRRLAGHLADQRLRPGDRAAICLGNRVEMVESYLAVTRAAGIGVPVNPRSTDSELAYLLDDSGARLMITDLSHAGQVCALAESRPHLKVVIADGEAERAGLPLGTLSYTALTATEPSAPCRDDLGLDDIAWMLYTSGTTGKPKGVLSTQRNGLWSIAACYVPIPGLSEDDRVVWPLPLFHSLAHIVCVLGVTAVGATARILEGFSATQVLRVIEEESATFVTGMPTHYHYLVRAARQRGFLAPSLRMGLVGGAVTTAELRHAFEETFGVPLLDAYGCTETCGAIAITWPTGSRPDGSCGLPVPGLGVRLVDPDTATDVPDGQEGEVWVRGPSVMVGYHGQPEATAEAMRDGWYRSGDLARRDATGFLTVTGRIKELIIRAGENIHPVEVEDVVRTVPGVADAAVVGKPHEMLGEIPVAFVVPGPDGVDPQRVLRACRERLSSFKVPEELYEISQIPRTGTGKIIRRSLLELPAWLRAAGSGQHESLLRWEWLPAPSVTAGRPGGRWAVVGQAAADIAAKLAVGGADAVTYRDLPAVRDDIAAGHGAPAVVIYAPASAVPDGDDRDDPAESAFREIRGLLSQAGNWLEEPASGDRPLVVVTRRAVAADVRDRVDDLAHAALWGWGRSAHSHYPGRLTIMDVDADADADADLAAAIRLAIGAGEPQVAVRSGVAFVPRLVRASAADQRARPFADRGQTVVITGADGAAAAAIACHLVAECRVRHLLLLSPRGRADQPAASLRADLARAGADVRLSSCDPCDRNSLARALARAGRSIGAVVHCCDPSGGPAPEIRRAVTDAAIHLDELMADSALRRFVLVFPTAGVIGRPGPGDAAEAGFLEGLAARRRARGLPALALAWEPVGTLPAREGLAMFDAAQLTDQVFLAAVRISTDSWQTQAVPPVLRGLLDTSADPGHPAVS